MKKKNIHFKNVKLIVISQFELEQFSINYLTPFGVSFGKDSSIYTSLNKRNRRILIADGDLRRDQKYANLQKRIKKLLDEDDNTFGERLNKLAHDDHFRKQFNELLQDDLFQKRCNKLMQDKHFQKRFSKLNNINNFEKQSFIPLNADHNNHDNSDPFKFCNSLEEFFDELKCKNDNKAKIMDELKRHEENKTKPKNEMKRTNNLKRKPADEVEDYMPFKLEKDENLERSLERYAYKGSVKPRKRSTLPTFLKKADKMFEAEVNRFFKKKAAGRYASKGRGIMGKLFSFINTHRVFIPILCLFASILIEPLIMISGTFVFGTLVLSALTLPVIVSQFLPLIGAAVLGYYAIKFDSASRRGVEHKKLSSEIKYLDRKYLKKTLL
ncbi:hypothetical protein PVBG_04227 [Plasmodium vivax Brazil I]|uniref:Pv-fam-d protein n=1 Tax=Plasmodium vivax (strain Brazil I) TaxID=1033975 RepID=A0A0J9SPX2_PLAV1|nr:hypothetical protein PVBG_04227 [Plasmodium vivax Brazil I]